MRTSQRIGMLLVTSVSRTTVPIPLSDLFTAAGLLDIWHSRVDIAASLDPIKQFYANREITHKGVDRILTSWVHVTVDRDL